MDIEAEREALRALLVILDEDPEDADSFVFALNACIRKAQLDRYSAKEVDAMVAASDLRTAA
jgi:hypothetical protein